MRVAVVMIIIIWNVYGAHKYPCVVHVRVSLPVNLTIGIPSDLCSGDTLCPRICPKHDVRKVAQQ